MSPIPLGILAASGGGAPPAMELIQTQLITSSVSSLTFASIPSGYAHLQIRATVRTDRSGNADDLMLMRVNSDTTMNYNAHDLTGNGSGVSSNTNTTQTYIRNNMRVAGGSYSTNGFGVLVMDILDYANTNKFKTIRHLGGIAPGGAQEINLGSAALRSTAAITNLQFAMYLTSTNFVAGTRFSLYGIKG